MSITDYILLIVWSPFYIVTAIVTEILRWVWHIFSRMGR